MRKRSDERGDLPRYVYVKPNGKLFFKHPKSGKLPLPPRDASDFMSAYHALMASVANNTLSIAVAPRHERHMSYAGDASMGALAAAYFGSDAFRRLETRTAHCRRLFIETCLQTMHPEPMGDGKPALFSHWAIDTVTKDVARQLRDALQYERTPNARPLKNGGDLSHWRDARMWAMRAMFAWASDKPYRWYDGDERRTVIGNPFQRIGNLYKPGDGHRTLTDDDCDQLEAYMIAERLHVDRLAFLLMRYTAVRRSDLVRIGKQHMRMIKSVTTGEKIPALVFQEWKGSKSLTERRTNKPRIIPIAPELLKHIHATPGALDRPVFIVGPRGKSPKHHDERVNARANQYGTHFNALCRTAELPEGSTCHGIRKHVGTRMADGGASPHQIAAMLGHTDIRNVLVYTRKANTQKLTEDGMLLIV